MMSVFGYLLFGDEVHNLRNKIKILFVIVNKTTCLTSSSSIVLDILLKRHFHNRGHFSKGHFITRTFHLKTFKLKDISAEDHIAKDHLGRTFNLKDISSEGHFSKDEILGTFRKGHFCKDILACILLQC